MWWCVFFIEMWLFLEVDMIRAMLQTLLVAGLIATALQPAVAQSDFLKRGNDLFRDFSGSTAPETGLTDAEIGSGLREALKVGADSVVRQVGAVDGFNADPRIHIPLPESLTTVQETLSRVGLSDMMDDLETRLNRAAEAAAPEAREVFWQAIDDMSWEDVRNIYEGPDDSATRYLETKMSSPLAERMKPIIDSSLAEVGAVQVYDSVMGRYRAVPFVPDVKADLTTHVLDRALAGLFLYLAEEEAAIRKNPAKRTTELLQKVFGS